MARTEQERSGCVTGLWSLFRPKKAHKGDNKVHPEAMDAAALKLKVQDRVCEAVSGEAMDAAALKLKELRRELSEEEQEKEAHETKELRREVKQEQEEEKHEEKSWSVSALRILIRLTEQLYEELNGKSSDRERIKRARKMMRLQKMLDRIPSERKPWKKLQSGEVVFVKEAKELYDRAGRDFVAEFKRRQRAEVNDECLFCQNHDGEKMIGRAGANSKTTRPWVYLRREHEQTVLSTSKKREMKLAPSSRSWLQGLVNWRPVLGL
ncbi:uncharacterized protein LOC9636267 [Selaginella moellendorffii]|uniref:uncharacterized protein LOC9636267 n=1 Tax=Selaginella moellendorffii TaxID=88036 RepID=UPI000D1CB200|nr:uncharacterized protein LOC9636267 [Selaginella moellendorffii]|eukprot:XP_024543114.1 uncharacterized protein LOC9636267 [Selaginella moellendorffii]